MRWTQTGRATYRIILAGYTLECKFSKGVYGKDGWKWSIRQQGRIIKRGKELLLNQSKQLAVDALDSFLVQSKL